MATTPAERLREIERLRAEVAQLKLVILGGRIEDGAFDAIKGSVLIGSEPRLTLIRGGGVDDGR